MITRPSLAPPRQTMLVLTLLGLQVHGKQARFTRAPHTERIASLLSSEQLDLAVLSRVDAVAMAAGRAPFADYGPIELRTLVRFGDHLLVCRDDFADRHAYMVTRALAAHEGELPEVVKPTELSERRENVPLHSGALAFWQGQAMPRPAASGVR